MASSEVGMSSSCPTFNCVLSPHNNNNNNNTKKKKQNNNNNVRNIHVAFEKNLNVFVRDHLDNCTVVSGDNSSSTKSVHECSSSVSDHRLSKAEESSSSQGPDPDPNPGQPGNQSRKENRAASSLVQIWEARTTQQPPSSNQNQSQIDSRTSSSGSNVLENTESLNEESFKEMIQPIEEEEEEEEIECDSQFVPPLPPEKEGVRVMDIIRKLSNDSETMTNNDNGSSSNNNDNSKEVQTTEVRSFPQVACSPRIRGRQAFADLLIQMMRDREKELASLLERRTVSKFTHRGRIQSTLRIRCYERCIAIQDRHRCKSSSAGSDLNRSPRGPGFLRGKYKTNTENIETGAAYSSVSSQGRHLDKDAQKATEKNVLQETIQKSDVKEIKEVILAVDNAKKAVLSEIVENKKGEKRETKEKAMAKESLEGRGEKRETKEKAITKESLEGKGEKRDTKEKAIITKESIEGRGEKRDTKEKKVIAKEGEKRETKENALNGIAEKVNLWNLEEKLNGRRGMEKGKSEGKGNNKAERVEKNEVLEEATRRIINVESAERSNITSWETVVRFEFGEKVVRRKKKEDCVLEDRNINPQEEQKISKEIIIAKKPIEKESSEERREREENVDGNSSMGIAEKVNLWNSKEKKNRRRVVEKGNGKTEGKTNTETNEILEEASRRMTNVETAERSIASPKETVDKVVGNKELLDKRESSTRHEAEEKGRRKKEENFASIEAKLKEIIEDKIMNLQEVTPVDESARDKEENSSQQGKEMSILPNSEAKSTRANEINNSQEVTQEGESTSGGSREKAKENDQNGIRESEDEETKKVEHEEPVENVKETTIECFNDWVENEMEEEEDDEYGDYYHYNGDNSYDWFNDISRPRSYWEDLRKERYLEVLNTESEKKDICNLIESRTVSNFLTSDLRQKIDNLMITRVHGHIGVETSQEEEDEYDEEQEEEQEWGVECSARNQEDNETEEEPEKPNLDACSQSPSWSFKDQEIGIDHEPPTTSLDVPEPPVPTNQSTQEMQMVSDLRGQMEQLQREMFELRNTVKSCIDMQLHFQKSVTQDLTRPGSSAEQRVDTKNDPLKRKCCICSENPIDSLLYRCGHMCTCLKCAHELQWSSKKCPICMAPIVDVVRAFLDS